MKLFKRWWFALFLAILALSHHHLLAQTSQPRQLSQSEQTFLASLPDGWLQNDANYWVAGELLVGRSADAQDVQASSLSAQLGFQPETVQSLTINLPSSDAPVRIERWLVPAGTEWSTIAFLREQPSILFAEPNWVVTAAEGESSASAGTIPTATKTATPTTTPSPSKTATFTATPTPSKTVTTTPVAQDINQILQPQPYVPNDPLYIDQQWYLQRINAARALALLDDGSGRIQPAGAVAVGLIDSGLDLTHPEFKDRILAGYNFWANSSDPNVETCQLPNIPLESVIDDFGHGTHVAGLIGASLNNSMGIASVAPFVKFQPLKILNGNGSGTVYDLATAITYAANCLDVKIINLSLEISASVLDNNPLLNNTLHTAIQQAYAKNILLIAAGGNSGGTVVPYPAAYEEVMGVASLNINNQRANYSTQGSQIDIAAPGGESSGSTNTRIYSTWSKDAVSRCRDGSYQELNGGGYCNDHGTSMATPLVVSAAALIWSVRPELSATQVRDILLQSATALDLPTDQVGSGRLDVQAALRKVLPSRLLAANNSYSIQSAKSTPPISLPVRLENPSTQLLAWQGQVTSGSQWISLGTIGKSSITGTVQYGHPAFFSIIVTPSLLSIGEHTGQINLSGANQISATIAIRILVSANEQQSWVEATTLDAQTGREIAASRRQWSVGKNGEALSTDDSSLANLTYYFPAVLGGTQAGSTATPTATATPTPTATPTTVLNAPAAVLPTTIAVPFRWEKPAVEAARSTYALSAQNPISLTLPSAFHFPMRGQNYDSLRILNDGYLVLPASEGDASQSNHCLPDLPAPNQAIFGWWAALNPAAVGSQISTFSIGQDRFVVEFSNVPSLGVSPAYTVSFQMVLYTNGDIGLNYLHVPSVLGKPSPVTIGAKARTGLFNFQVACATANENFGEPPRSGQSFLIKAAYLY
ncbi:MAG: S8 family serine peptidase [Caldilineaceae bacterium]